MNRTFLSMAAASMLLTGIGLASAQTTTTTTTWTNEHGTTIRRDSTTNKYTSFKDPALKPTVGVVLPGAVTLYALPGTITIPSRENYSYAIVNDRPVVVERSTRRVVHSWD